MFNKELNALVLTPDFRLRISLLALILIIAIYLPGIKGPWLFDDIPNIATNPAITEAQSLKQFIQQYDKQGISAGRPLSLLTFWLNQQSCDGHRACFRLTNLLIHFVNTLLLAFLVQRLITGMGLTRNRGRIVLLLAVGIWAVHPIHSSNTLYIVQRMNLLSAFFVLAPLCIYIQLRLAQVSRTTYFAGFLLISLLLLAGMSAKQNAALFGFYLAVLEILLRRLNLVTDSTRESESWRNFCLAVYLVIPCVVAIIVFALKPEMIIGGYAHRSFTLEERLLTEPRVLVNYLFWMAIPLKSHFSLFHDDIGLSTGLFTPFTTLPAIVFIAAATIVAFRTKSYPWLTFGWLWFMAGHLMESSIIALELVFEHRNYLPSAGLIVGIAVQILVGRQTCNSGVKLDKAICINLFACFFLFCCVNTALLSFEWGSRERLLNFYTQHHPNSMRANCSLGNYHLDFMLNQGNSDAEALELAAEFYQRANNSDPLAICGYSGQLLLKGYFGYSIDEKQSWMEIKQRLTKYAGTVSNAAHANNLYRCFEHPECKINRAQLLSIYPIMLNQPLTNSVRFSLEKDFKKLSNTRLVSGI